MNHFRQGIKNIPEICAQLGVRKIVISPGSRNAPLIFAFTSQSEMECFSITDERSAGYFAIGLSQQSGEAVALVCTSGTAVLNFAPAIAEAYYQNVALLVFTADRPAELIDQADGQTLRQSNIFANYIKASFDLPMETVVAEDLYYSDRQVSQAIEMATSYPQGPVQINVPLREPIYTALPEQHSHPKIIKTSASSIQLSKQALTQLQESWLTHKRKLIVIGVFSKNKALNDLAIRLAQEPDVVVVAENLSNVAGPSIITQLESLFSRINSLSAKDFQPDLLITIGHSVICKQLKLFLRGHQPAEQWQLESTMPYVDTYKSLTTVVPATAVDVLSQMPLSQTNSTFSSMYQEQLNCINDLHQAFVTDKPLSDMTITAALLQQAPANAVLHLANSTSVRWAQLFASRPDLTYICNRGTSGIDGSLSTAAGYAYASEQEVVFLTGDLSFIYDSNGLWNNYIRRNLKIVVMNNGGGNIFRFIGDKELMQNSIDFFTTPHNVNIQSLVKTFGLHYISCNESKDLAGSIAQLFAAESATVLEIFTDSDVNTENYKAYFKNIKTQKQ